MNSNLNLPIFTRIDNYEITDFIKFWSQLYYYPSDSDNLYNGAISKLKYDEIDIEKFFKWKNGMELSIKKQKSFEQNIKSKLPEINMLKAKNDFSLNEFLDKFKNIKTTVWRIFLLHIIKPEKYPIYDQNIYRTYNFIHNKHNEPSPTSLSERGKEEFYIDKYLPFIDSLRTSGIDIRTIDKAFFAFGQFLKTKEYAKLLNY